MRYYKIIIDGYLAAVGTGAGGEEITEAEYNSLLKVIRNKPTAESGFDYRLKADLTWEKYELPQIEETETAYTAEQLEAMTVAELEAVCAELGISPNKNKANMVVLILNKQGESNGR